MSFTAILWCSAGESESLLETTINVSVTAIPRLWYDVRNMTMQQLIEYKYEKE
jgi:hypothetical protein